VKGEGRGEMGATASSLFNGPDSGGNETG